MIVVDSSALAKYILREENFKAVREYLDDEPYSLDLALAEASNAVWKHFVLYKKISRNNAALLIKALTTLRDVVIFEPLENYLQPAIEIAMSEETTVYDALYIAQAKKLGGLLTSDEIQGEIARKLGIKVIRIK